MRNVSCRTSANSVHCLFDGDQASRSHHKLFLLFSLFSNFGAIKNRFVCLQYMLFWRFCLSIHVLSSSAQKSRYRERYCSRVRLISNRAVLVTFFHLGKLFITMLRTTSYRQLYDDSSHTILYPSTIQSCNALCCNTQSSTRIHALFRTVALRFEPEHAT